MTSTVHKTTVSTRPALVIYGVIALALFVFVAFFAHADLPLPYRQGVKPADYSGPAVLEGWVRFDAGWYRSIAEHGYYFRGDREQSSVAFFPVYPLVMRGFHSVFGGDTAAWGILITLLSGLTVAILFYRWCVVRIGETGARYALARCSCCGPTGGTSSARSTPTRSSSRWSSVRSRRSRRTASFSRPCSVRSQPPLDPSVSRWSSGCSRANSNAKASSRCPASIGCAQTVHTLGGVRPCVARPPAAHPLRPHQAAMAQRASAACRSPASFRT